MAWSPEVNVENPLEKQVYRALFDGDFAEIVRLDNQGIDWEFFTPPLYLPDLHNHTSVGEWLESFFSSRIPQQTTYENNRNKIGFSYSFSDFCLLMKACEHGDLEILENYFHFSSQWHVLHYEPISETIFAYNFEIADQLIAHGTNLKRWPNFLWKLFMSEFELFCHSDYLTNELPRTEALLYAIKAGAELNYYGYSYSYFQKTGTVLDFARQIDFETLVKILLESGAKTVAELMQ